MASSDAKLAAGVGGPTRARIDAQTLRTDRWWLAPLATFVVFSAFVVYATWRAFQGSHYYSSPYLSPFYSPCLTDDCVKGSSDFGKPFGWWQLSPPACAVAEPHGKYTGETRPPLILQNLHRYFWYAAMVVAAILTFDTVLAFRNADHEWGHMGLGTLLMLGNVVLIWLYTLSCHSCRHAVGGRLRHFSKHPVRYRLWTWVSRLNVDHAKYAWYSLFSVALVDLYIYLLAANAFDDPRFF